VGKSEITVLTRLLALFHAFDKSIGMRPPDRYFSMAGLHASKAYENNLTVGDARTGDSSPENESESGPRIPFSSTHFAPRLPDGRLDWGSGGCGRSGSGSAPEMGFHGVGVWKFPVAVVAAPGSPGPEESDPAARAASGLGPQCPVFIRSCAWEPLIDRKPLCGLTPNVRGGAK